MASTARKGWSKELNSEINSFYIIDMSLLGLLKLCQWANVSIPLILGFSCHGIVHDMIVFGQFHDTLLSKLCDN